MRHTHPTLRFIPLLFMLLLWTAPCANADGLGPFFLPAIGTDESYREIPAFVSPNDHTEGRFQLNTTARWTNIWAYHIESDKPYDWDKPAKEQELKHGSFFIDVERLTVTNRISFRATDALGFEATIPFVCQGGGIMDGFIEGFHKTFGIGQHHRTDWDRDDASFDVVNKNGVLDDANGHVSDTYFGNIQVGASYRFLNRWPISMVRILAKLPTSNYSESLEFRGYDVTLQGSTAWQWGRFLGYHGAGVSYFGDRGPKDVDFKRVRYSMMNTGEVMLSPEFSLILHTVAATAAADYPELDEPIIEVTLGFKKVLGAGVFEFGLIENMIYYDNSPDFGLHAGYSISFL